jgi:ferredoxin
VLHQVLGIYLPLITTNCAVLGVPLLNVANKHNFSNRCSSASAAPSAFRWCWCCSPASASASRRRRSRLFPGTAIAMVTAGLMSLAFMGFAGLDKYQCSPPSSSWRWAPSCSAPRWATLDQVQGRRRPAGREDRRHPAADAMRPVRLPRLQALRRSDRQGEADINQCPPGGDGRRAQAGRPARPRGQAARRSRRKAQAVAIIDEQTCIGCTLCIQACPVDAIVGAAKQMHTIVAALCTGCELCLPPCPVECIAWKPIAETVDNWKWKYPVIEIKKRKRA